MREPSAATRDLDGSTDATMSYRIRGHAPSAFKYAKIGICVHHPVLAAMLAALGAAQSASEEPVPAARTGGSP